MAPMLTRALTSIVLASGASVVASDTSASAIVGEWKADDGSAIVAVAPAAEGSTFVGTVVWLADPSDKQGRPRTDVKNPSKDLRQEPIVGLQVVSGLRPVSDETWDHGTAYDPKSGRSYACSARVTDHQAKLTITVTKGPFHQTRTCSRVAPQDEVDPG